jgi:hypothetical protein
MHRHSSKPVVFGMACESLKARFNFRTRRAKLRRESIPRMRSANALRRGLPTRARVLRVALMRYELGSSMCALSICCRWPTSNEKERLPRSDRPWLTSSSQAWIFLPAFGAVRGDVQSGAPSVHSQGLATSRDEGRPIPRGFVRPLRQSLDS